MHFSRDSVWPGNANLPIGDLQYANREIGVPRFQTMQCVPSVRCDWQAIPVESPRMDGLSGRWPCAAGAAKESSSHFRGFWKSPGSSLREEQVRQTDALAAAQF